MSNNLSVQFINRSRGATSYRWDFGDGISINDEESPEHTYAVGGAYVATLTATGGAGVSQVSQTVITIGVVSDILLSTARGDAVATADGDFLIVPPP